MKKHPCIYYDKGVCKHDSFGRVQIYCLHPADGTGGMCFNMRVKTNADRIRAMSDEELIGVFGHQSICNLVQDHYREHCEKQSVCDGCLVAWLKQPAEEDE